VLTVKNIFTEIPTQLPEELCSCLVQNAQLHIERIVSRGHQTAPGQWYDQDHDEWVLLIQGAAILAFDAALPDKKLQAGDYCLIPAHCKHRVAWTHPDMDSIWLAVHYNKQD